MFYIENCYFCNMEKTRFDEIDRGLEASMRMTLNQIRTFLDLRKASVMVGAGLSKNAEMVEDATYIQQ